MPDFALIDPNPRVVRTCKVFEVGDYPDKAFALSEAEAQDACAAFTPAALDIEHVPSVLDGKLGTLQSLYLDADQTTLVGDVAIPQWLDRVLDGTPVKLSAAWDRETKRLQKLALVLNPRITDAVLMSAFAAAQEEDEDAWIAFATSTSKPWNGSASRFPTPDAYCRSALVDENPAGAPKTKDKCHLPVREPDGTVNLNALRAAASAVAGGRTGKPPP